ncbi:uncharacterized protein [Triticum aestivum]|uniref:uncharacterized protein isoform X2 n=1 Tax=Triticum aestivum TaxID=4565 RepID=UPI001D01066C|nr:uncharacterized protein LOC123145778 isoform X2 [Triticum aestivum]
MVDDSLPFQCLGAPSSCFTPLENAGIPYLGWCCTAWLSSKFNGDGNCQFWASSVQFYRTPEHRIFVRQQLVKHVSIIKVATFIRVLLTVTLESHWLIMRYILDMSLWITENILRRCQKMDSEVIMLHCRLPRT